ELARMTQRARREAEERAAREAAEEVLRRTAFLAEASKVLSASLDYEATRRGLLRLVVPRLADAAALALAEDQGDLREAELAWVGPTSGVITRTAAGPGALAESLAEALRGVLATGKPAPLPDIAPEPGAGDGGRAGPPFPLR